MRKPILSLIFAIVAISSVAQIRFESGYFINNQDIKTDCLIKNIDWSNNPTSFTYKLDENDKTQETDIENVKEFGIYETSKYVRYILPIDKSGSNINVLSKQRAPEWDIDTVFLKIVVDGVATLYSYKKSSLQRFFYSVPDSLPKQLIYKKYNTDDGMIYEDKTFQNQLLAEVKIEGASINSVTGLEYKLKNLEKYFIRYNEAKGLTFSVDKKSRNKINLKIEAGITMASLSLSNSRISQDDSRIVDFGSNYNYRFGVDAELILPFNRNKWAVFCEPAFSKYHFETEYKTYYDMGTVTAEINTLEIGFGARYFIYLSEKAKISIGASLQYDMNFNSIIDYSDHDDLLFLGKTLSFVGLGIGYSYDDWITLEIKRMPARGLLENINWGVDFNVYSLNLGFNIMKLKKSN